MYSYINVLILCGSYSTVAMSGSITVRNMGGYVAKFYVEFTVNGQRYTRHSGVFSLGVNKAIELPAGSTDIVVKAEEMWGFGWSTIFVKNYAYVVTKSFELGGTTLDPSYNENY